MSRRAARASASSVTASERAAAPQPDDRGHVLEPGPPGPLLVAADEQRPQPQPAAHEQRADARRAAELVGADRQQVGAEVVEVDRARGRRPGPRRRARARPRSRHAATTSATGCSVPTSWLPHCTCTSAGVGPDRVGASRRRRRGRRRSHADDRHLDASARRRQPHRRVLDRGHDHVRRPARAAPHVGRGDRLGRSAGEHDLAGPGAEQRGDRSRASSTRDPGRRALRRGSGRDRRAPVDCSHASIASTRLGPQRRGRRVVEVVARSRRRQASERR